MGMDKCKKCKKWMSICLAAALLVAAGCASKKHLTADQYFAKAGDLMRDEAYSLAAETYRELLDQYPFSDYTEEAELRIAHAHYLSGDYIEAIVALTDFQRRHPTSPHLPFVGYHLGMAYKLQMGTIDRDQSSAESADTYFATVVYQYPDSPYAELARAQLSECRSSRAAHELYVAEFYAKKGNELAAENRRLAVVGQFPETDAAGRALYNLGRMYGRRNDAERAALAFTSVVEQYPKSDYANAARRELSRLGGEAATEDADPRAALLLASGFQPGGQADTEAVDVPGLEPGEARPRSAGVPPITAPAYRPNVY